MRPMAGAIVHDGHEAHDDGRAATVALWGRGARRIAVPDHNPLQRIIRKTLFVMGQTANFNEIVLGPVHSYDPFRHGNGRFIRWSDHVKSGL